MQNKEWFKFLEDQNFVPSKKMGQNFLLNQTTQKNIVTSSQITSNDNVLEIGPGLGAITQHLLQTTDNVLAVELDKRLYAFLKEKYPHLKIINNDVLKTDLDAELNQLGWSNVKVVANLPYSISSLIVVKLLKCKNIGEINILVQKEMAERLSAKVNTKDYNAFTVLVALYADVSVRLKVSRNDFYPIPNVDSWFINFKLKHFDEVPFDEIDKFLKLCFIARRKKMINNLSQQYDKNLLSQIYQQLGWDENLRAETLEPKEFIKLYNLIKG